MYGVRTLAGWCLGRGCNHQRVVDVSAYPDDVTVPSFGPRLRCEVYGHRGAEARPKWSEMHKHADERLSAMRPIATEYIAAQRMTRSAITGKILRAWRNSRAVDAHAQSAEY